jgi:hypothetical protein
LRYKEILGGQGVAVDERMTGGAVDNLRLLLDPKSGVDVAFMQGTRDRSARRPRLRAAPFREGAPGLTSWESAKC